MNSPQLKKNKKNMKHYTTHYGELRSKIKYDTFELAMNNAIKYNSNANNLGKKILHPYKCSDCGKFHLGKQGSFINENLLNKNIIKVYSGILSKVKFNIDISLLKKTKKFKG